MMRSRTLSGVALVAVSTLAARQPQPLRVSCDVFRPGVSVESLLLDFGGTEVAADSLPLGPTEGDMVPATVLFPHDPQRRIAIVWKDPLAKRGPRFVYLRHGPTRWKTPEGITIGTSLHDLEALNGRPFHVAGFATDGSGAVTSWDGGKLESLSTGACRIWMYLDSLGTLGPTDEASYQEVVGGIYSSKHPSMQRLNPRVLEILLEYQ